LEEQQALIDMIENCISDLRTEIRDTDRLDYKEMLKNRKALLTKLVESLYQAVEEA
jgi:hypothetical protein